MTDPVDTDALNTAWEKYAALNDLHPHSIERDTFEQGWDAAADELDRLRAMIENAPHDIARCRATRVQPLDPLLCTCWKADAL